MVAETPPPAGSPLPPPTDGAARQAFLEATRISDHPNPWALVTEGAKTVVTLAVALLGITVTFATNLISEDGKTFVAFGWLALVVAIGGAIYTMFDVEKHVRSPAVAAKFWSSSVILRFNVSFVFLAVGSLLIAIGAWQGWSEPDSSDVGAIIERSREAVEDLGPPAPPGAELIVESLLADSGTFTVVLTSPDASASYRVVIDDDLTVVSAQADP